MPNLEPLRGPVRSRALQLLYPPLHPHESHTQAHRLTVVPPRDLLSLAIRVVATLSSPLSSCRGRVRSSRSGRRSFVALVAVFVPPPHIVPSCHRLLRVVAVITKWSLWFIAASPLPLRWAIVAARVETGGIGVEDEVRDEVDELVVVDKGLVELVELVLDVDELDEDNTRPSRDRSQLTRHRTFHSSDETTSTTAPELSDVARCLRLCVKRGKGSSRTGPIAVTATVAKGERGWGQWGALHCSPCHRRQRHPGNVAGEVHCLRVAEKGEINTLDRPGAVGDSEVV
ncbi:hypothetical protein EDB83DRAFT_2311742 [Lactarius deliciosus]|nr:hypothetical protein EDB83DRAFT_2311742 [Lactarius deliciosus]